MRKIICLAFLSLNMIASAQGAIGLTEYCVLYSGGWDNKVVVGYTGMKSSSISVSGGTAVAANWNDGNGNYSGYFVRVAEGAKMVSADFNINSTNTIDGGPVAEWNSVNANQLIYQTLNNNQGSFRLV